MKAKYFSIMFISVLVLSVCILFSGGRITVSANSAAPIKPDDGSGIVFEQHEHIQIQSEVLDIIINDDITANISASYIMKNISTQALTVETMFLTPVEYGDNKNISVKKNGEELDFDQEYYSPYSYHDSVAHSIDNWESILADARSSGVEHGDKYVAAIVYYVDFAPDEELELSVSYVYQMGTSGYRHTVDLHYYLTPAKYWKDFAGIEINLTLGEKYKKLKSASLSFNKIDDKHYKFSSDTLPDSELIIQVNDGSFISSVGCGAINIDTFTLSGLILLVSFAVFILCKKRTREINAVPDTGCF